jgi:vacuolar-type H+-ATPase subunit I/STV1
MKILILLLCLPLSATGQIFKCSDKDNTVFSDSPCGKNAELIEVEVPQRNNMQLSNQKIGKLADELHTTRRKRELNNRVTRERHHLEKINKNYQATQDKLQEELNKVNAEKQRYKRKYAPLQESRLKDKAKDIREKLADARRKYHSDEAAAKAALNEAIRQKAQFE